MPKLVITCNIVWCIFNVAHVLSYTQSIQESIGGLPFSQSGDYIVTVGILFPAMVALCFTLRKWIRKQARIHELVQGFSIKSAACAVEADRSLVQKNVVAFMKQTRRTPRTGSDAEAMEAFDQLVCNEVPALLEASFGRAGIPYRYVFVMFLSQTLRCLDQVGAQLYQEENVRVLSLTILEYATIHVAYAAIGLFLAYRFMHFGLRIKGVLEWTFVVASSLILCLLGAAFWFVLYRLSAHAQESNIALSLFLGYAAILLLLVYVIYRPLRYGPTGPNHNHWQQSSISTTGNFQIADCLPPATSMKRPQPQVLDDFKASLSEV